MPRPEDLVRLVHCIEIPVERLVRLSRRPDSEPYWSTSRSHRFDDPEGRYGVCYAADSIETAFCESVLHSSALRLPGISGYILSQAMLDERHEVRFRTKRSASQLRLADLTGTSLKLLGETNDLSATDDYTRSQIWSRVVFQATGRFDGIRYVSRQRNTHFCFALFRRSGLLRASACALSTTQIEQLTKAFGVPIELPVSKARRRAQASSGRNRKK